MIHLTREQIFNLSEINSGTFGFIYQINDKVVYKIYRDRIPNIMGVYCDNPVLSFSKARLERLKNRTKKLKYTESIQDTIYINGKFGGIVLPYFDGEQLHKFTNSKFQIKMDYSNQLIRNHKELLSHFIFPNDYKLNNVIVSHNMIKIIDIDDELTSLPIIPLPHHYLHSNYSLSRCISSLFDEKNHSKFSYHVISQLKNTKIKPTLSLLALENQLHNKEKEHQFLILDFSFQGDLSHEDLRKKILLISNENTTDSDVLRVIDMIHQKGCSLFDVIPREQLDNYFLNFNTSLCIDSQHSIIYQKKKDS